MADLQCIHIVGAGLIGTSVGLACTRAGLDVSIEDLSRTNAAIAGDLGAGATVRGDGDGPDPDLVLIATPPDVTAACVAQALQRWPRSSVADVSSVKQVIIDQLRGRGVDLSRFCASHPMAGRERSGAISARYDLFDGRAWVITPVPETGPDVIDRVRRLAEVVGATSVTLDVDEHDAAVAAISHVPQVMSSLVAARLEHVADASLALAGQGLRDVTRVAGSDPHLWTQILSGNAAAVRDLLTGVADDLNHVIQALIALGDDGEATGARGILAQTIAAGNAGRARIPGKHGSAPTAYATVRVLIPDEPGQLGRLFADVGEVGVNVEEFSLDHGLGQAFGLAEIQVLPASVGTLKDGLRERGWRLHG